MLISRYHPTKTFKAHYSYTEGESGKIRQTHCCRDRTPSKVFLVEVEKMLLLQTDQEQMDGQSEEEKGARTGRPLTCLSKTETK